MRARVSNFVSGTTANMDVGANDDGGLFAAVPSPPGNGVGAPVDVSAFGTFNTWVVAGSYTGTVVIEISEDGIDWAQCVSFGPDGGALSKQIVAQFMRVRRQDVRSPPGLPDVNVGAINDTPAGVGGGDSNCLIYQPGGGQTGPVVWASWPALMAKLASLRAAANGQGCYTIAFDDSIVSPAVVPAGLYDMTNVSWVGLDPAPRAVVSLADGVSLTRLRRFKDVDVSQDGTTAPIVDLATGEGIELDNTVLSVGVGTAPLIAVAAGVVAAEFDLRNSTQWFGGAGVPLLSLGAAASATARLRADANIAGDTIAGPVGSSFFVLYSVDSGDIGATQTGFLGTLAASPADQHRYGLDPTIYPAGGPSAVAVNAITRADTTLGTKTFVLPKADVNNRGKRCVIKKMAGASPVLMAATGLDTIVGATSIVTPTGTRTYASDGASTWLEIAAVDEEAAGRYAPPEQWTQNDVPAAQAATPMSAQVSTLFDEIQTIRAGSIVGLNVRFNAALTAGSATAVVTVNGVASAAAVAVASPASSGRATFLFGTAPFAAGDLIGVTLATSAGFLPSGSLDVEAWIEVDTQP
jgi:hypothetical protein